MTKLFVGAFTLMMATMLSAAPQAPAPAGSDQTTSQKTGKHHRKHGKKKHTKHEGQTTGSKLLNAPAGSN